jgi:hypothetical protein
VNTPATTNPVHAPNEKQSAKLRITMATTSSPAQCFSLYYIVSPTDLIRPAIMARTAQMNLRVRPDLKAKLEKLAKEDRRTLSAYVEKLLEDHVKSGSQVGVKNQKRTKQRSAL